MPQFIDTHAHLDFPELADQLAAVLDRAAENEIHEIVTIGIDVSTSQRAVALAQEHSRLYASVGIHPHGARELDTETLHSLGELARNPGVVAIGEIGLDYYRDRQPRAVQRSCFRQQLELACAMSLPAVFHVRDAYEDFLAIVEDYRRDLVQGIVHCFSGTWEVARKCLELGFYLSMPGTVTFPKALTQQEVARRMPLERLLLETDAPFLAPVPYRGKVNEPALLVHTAHKIAQLRDCEVAAVARQTTDNARTVLQLEDR